MIDSWEIRTQDREEGSGRFPSMISVLWLGVWDNVANDAQEGLFFFFFTHDNQFFDPKKVRLQTETVVLW